MTKEEKLKILRTTAITPNIHPDDFGKWNEALRSAIQALSAEPCEDCISRISVLDTLDNTDEFMDEERTVENYKALLKECYEVLPSVTPKQKMGRWLAVENEDMETVGYYCSECDLPMETEEQTSFCPNCGAKMVESEVSE